MNKTQLNITEEEWLDLVDESDQVVGKLPRSEVYAQKLTNFRVINAFLINPDGKIFFPRRASNKRLFPNALDMSVGGHVSSGENYREAFVRELEEELGIKADQVKITVLGRLNPRQHNTSAFMEVYEIAVNETPAYNTDDFTEYFWLTPQELLQKLNDGDISKDDLPKLINHFYIQNS